MFVSNIAHLLPIIYPIFTCVDPTKFLNTDPMWIRIHNALFSSAICTWHHNQQLWSLAWSRSQCSQRMWSAKKVMSRYFYFFFISFCSQGQGGFAESTSLSVPTPEFLLLSTVPIWQDAGIRTWVAATAARCATNDTMSYTHPCYFHCPWKAGEHRVSDQNSFCFI